MEYVPTNEIHRKLLGAKICKKLLEMDFDPHYDQIMTATYSQREIEFTRNINERMEVRVFTSVIKRGESFEVREVGEDAIRVIARYKNSNGTWLCIGKTKRVNRTGDIQAIVDRVHKRCQELWRVVVCKTNQCSFCGSPKFESRNGNMVCREICWEKSWQEKQELKRMHGVS